MDSNSLGFNIRRYREKNNITQETLGSLIGVSYQQIQKYENGSTRISYEKLSMISEALDVPVSLITGEKDPIPYTENQEDGIYMHLTSEEVSIIQKYREISDSRLKKVVLPFIKTLNQE